MLPDIAKNFDNIQVFSTKEEYDYLLQNGMHNKKQRQKVSNNIKILKDILSKTQTQEIQQSGRELKTLPIPSSYRVIS